jgi:hypothetical protein
MDELLKLFVVLYLKSSMAVRFNLMEDLDNIFIKIKEDET